MKSGSPARNAVRQENGDRSPKFKYKKQGSYFLRYTDFYGEKCVILAEVQFEARGLQCAEDKIASLPNASEIDRFLSSADDKEFLMIKVGLILGIAGACRTDELVNLTVDDIEDVGSSLNVKIPNTKTKIPRIFVVTDGGKYA
ncbi:hypothetical protein NQ317_004629 [Molorchus minor]|uniref:Tyr recombinase domain-containing protein n=1 Tax=Molorchus minor TaxID=1323400 RepID=A0ABQ9JIX3_9CUCU|nr:hypothetical protein NQ317_004629 [Molorchus minor]